MICDLDFLDFIALVRNPKLDRKDISDWYISNW